MDGAEDAAGRADEAEAEGGGLRAELIERFAVVEAPVRQGSSLKTRGRAATGSSSSSIWRLTLLDPKQSHLKAIGIHALAASLPSSAEPGTPRSDAELAGAMRLVDTLAAGEPDAFTQDQLVMLADLLPTDDDLRIVAAYSGPVDSLGVVERFTRACGELPLCRERVSAMLARVTFSERCETLQTALFSMSEVVAAVRASAERGVLRSMLRTALAIYRCINDDSQVCGLRLMALSRFEGYQGTTRHTNLLQFLGMQLQGGAVSADLARLERCLASVSRVVWMDVRHDVDALGRSVDELGALATRLEAAAAEASEQHRSEQLAAFAHSVSRFCADTTAAAMAEVRTQHEEVEAATRALLGYLAVEERAWSRPEETLAALHEVVLAIRQAQRHHALEAKRAATRILASDKRSATAAVTQGDGVALVDGVADRFSHQPPTADDWSGNDRSAELLRLLLRRASIAGLPAPNAAGSSGDEEDGEDYM